MQISERRNLSNGFSRYFRIDPALDDRLLDEVFHVRHEVYCEDLGFEPPRPDHREIDVYDAHKLKLAVYAAQPDVIIHQLTDLPQELDPQKLQAALDSNARLRIDAAMTLGYGFPMGPLKLTDLVGIDVRLGIARYLEKELGPRFAPPRLMVDMVERGELGRKSGRGFYDWTDAP